MPFLFDATLKDIVRECPGDFAAAFAHADRPAKLLNVDLSTVFAASDAVLGLGDPLDEILDINF